MAGNTIEKSIVVMVKEFATEVNKLYPLEKTLIFGSQAKGGATQFSDIDVCLVSKHFTNDMNEIRYSLRKIVQQFDDRIEVHPMLPEDFNNRYYTFAQEVKTFGIVV